ncbi:MAG: hypothetical protein AAGA48_05865 [Myxococcota bacterium]
MGETQMPTTTPEWTIWAWGVGGVVLILSQAVFRLAPRALSLFDMELAAWHVALAVGWVIFMAYTESYRGFHLQFNPRVVVRAAGIAKDPAPWRIALAPLVAMGLLYGTPRRLLVSRLLVAGIVVLVLLVRLLPEPWRALVDLGVVIGLALGVLSLLGFAVQAVLGRLPNVDPEFPA